MTIPVVARRKLVLKEPVHGAVNPEVEHRENESLAATGALGHWSCLGLGLGL